jgi:hypothetical protein
MASFVSGLWNHLKPASAHNTLLGTTARRTLIILHGATRQSYVFEVHPLEAASSLDVGAVYVYARDVAGDTSRAKAADSNSRGLDIGYIGDAGDLARQVEEHERRGHFIGHAFDLMLILGVADSAARAQIAHELTAYYRPVLNDLLGGNKSA